MKIDFIKPPITGEPVPPRILMRLETHDDRRVIEKIMAECDRLAALGRDPRDGELIHVSICVASDA